MDLQQTIDELSLLPVEDRLRLIHSLWNSISPETPIELSPEQRRELERRIAEHDADPSTALTREELNARLGRE